MNYIDLQNELKKLGIDISIITLRRYVKAGLMPEPERKHLGRGKGEQVFFPLTAVAEAGATRLLIKEQRNPPVEIIREARLLALETVKRGEVAALIAKDQNILPHEYQLRFLAFLWLKFWTLLKQGFNINTPGYWEITSNGIKFICDYDKNDKKRVDEVLECATDIEKEKI